MLIVTTLNNIIIFYVFSLLIFFDERIRQKLSLSYSHTLEAVNNMPTVYFNDIVCVTCSVCRVIFEIKGDPVNSARISLDAEL